MQCLCRRAESIGFGSNRVGNGFRGPVELSILGDIEMIRGTNGSFVAA